MRFLKVGNLSVDYVTDLKTRTISQGLTTEGFRNEDDPLWKFERWIRIDEYVKYPKVLYNLFPEYPVIIVSLLMEISSKSIFVQTKIWVNTMRLFPFGKEKR